MVQRFKLLGLTLLLLLGALVINPTVSHAQAFTPASSCNSNLHWTTVRTADQDSGGAHMHAQLQAMYDSNGTFCFRVIANAYLDEPFAGPNQELDATLVDDTANADAFIHTASCTTRVNCIHLSSTSTTDKYEAGGPGNSVGIASGIDECFYAANAFSPGFDFSTDTVFIPGCN